MTLKLYAGLSMVVVSLTSANPHAADVKNQSAPVRVQLQVSGDQDLADQVTSYFARELRKIPDVAIADDRPAHVISVVIMRLQSVAQTHTGYALSLVVTDFLPIRLSYVTEVVGDPGRDHGALDFLVNKTDGLLSDHRLLIFGPSDLQATCAGPALGGAWEPPNDPSTCRLGVRSNPGK